MPDFPLDDYHNWLYWTAAGMLPGGYYDPGIEDLAQEGRIAMWKALDAYDDAKGTLAPWVTNAARARMRNIAGGRGRPTGHKEVRGFTEARVVAYLDAQEPAASLDLAQAVVDVPEPVLMEVLRELSDQQREYIWLRFWCGVDVSSRAPAVVAIGKRYPVLKKKWHWDRARAILARDPRILSLAGRESA